MISGLCEAVLVIEAARHSGSLITARWAVDQGRTVFALPGRIDHPLAQGTLRLLRDGATPVGSPEELLGDLGREVAPLLGEDARGQAVDERHTTGLLGALLGETLTADELALRMKQPVEKILGALAQLELEGTVVRAPGGLYRRGRLQS